MLEELNEKFPNIRSRLLKPFVVKTDPNVLTVLAFLAAVSAGFLFYYGFLFLAAILVFINGFLDVLDGEIAKRFGKTNLGDFLDHTFDRLSDLFIILGISLSPNFGSPLLGIFAAISVLLVSYLGTMSHALTRKRIYTALMGRADRITLILVASLLALFWNPALFYAIAIVFIFSVLSFIQRFYLIYRELV
jgi:phosphatidylglycerophosphate synthase